MAKSLINYTGDGTTTDFLFDIPYIKEADVSATVNGIATSVTFVDPTHVRILPAPPVNDAIVILRTTSNTKATFTFPDLTYMRSANLDGDFTQQLYLHQEAEDLHDWILANNGGAAAALSAAEALASETNAATSETNAATSETNAATSETNAATSETNAATSETNAAASAALINFADDKAAAVSLTPTANSILHILSADGKGNIWKSITGAAPGTYSDDGGTFCGTVLIPTGGDGSEAWIRDYIGVMNVRWFGAVGDSIADDATAVQLTIDRAILNSGQVYFPKGNYKLGTSVGPQVETFGLHYLGDGIQKTVITGDHNTGPVMSGNRSNFRVSDLTITASVARTAGSATSGAGWQDNVGLYIEPPDIATKSVSQCELSHLRILSQPSHGLAWVGPAQDNSITHVLCQDNKGHGAVFDAGILTGRVNKTQMGQMTAIDFWAVGNGGNGLAIGNPNDVGATTPYRFVLINPELADNGTDAAFYYTPHELWMHSENSIILGGAVGGKNLRGGIAFSGRHLKVDNVRFVQSQPAMTLYADPDPTQTTSMIQISNVRNIATTPALNPAIVINDLAKVLNVTVDTASRGNVTSWFTPGALLCVVNEFTPTTNVTKKSNDTVNNSTSIVSDSELKIALANSDVVHFEALLKYTGSSTADIKFAFTVPVGATIRWQPHGSIYVGPSDTVVVKTGDVVEGATLAFGCQAGTRTAHLQGRVIMGSTAGNLQLTWAQSTADLSDTSILAGSNLKVVRSNYNL